MTITISEVNKSPLIDNHVFNVGDIIFMNNYGEPYYATESQWLEQDYHDIGFSEEFSNDQYLDCFNGNSEWFTEFEIIDDE